MKICILSAFEDSMLKDTGASVRIYNLSKGLASLGHDINLLIPKSKEYCENIDGVKVHGLRGFLPENFLKVICSLMGISRPTALRFYDFLFIFRASRAIRGSDIVQIEQQSAGALLVPFAAKVLRKPVVLDCHDTFQAMRVRNTNTPRRIFETFFEKITYRFASLIMTVSQKEKDFLISLGIDQNQIEVIPNGVDTAAFTRSIDTVRISKLYGLTGRRVVVFVGNMEYGPNKEAVHLISSRIAPMVEHAVKDVKFLVVGRNGGVSYPNLSYTGIVKDVAPILAVSDVAIAPLLHGSGTKLKILEYFSCSLPVVSTSIGVEGLDIGNGIHALVEDDADLFASKLIELLNDSQLARQLGQSARELVVSTFDWDKMIVRLERTYLQLLSGNR